MTKETLLSKISGVYNPIKKQAYYFDGTRKEFDEVVNQYYGDTEITQLQLSSGIEFYSDKYNSPGHRTTCANFSKDGKHVIFLPSIHTPVL